RVDKAGGDNLAGRGQPLPRFGRSEPAHGGNLAPLDADIGPVPRVAAAVHDLSVTDQDVKHGRPPLPEEKISGTMANIVVICKSLSTEGPRTRATDGQEVRL